MALWDSLTNKTTTTALAFNRILNNKTLDAVRRRYGLMNRILGKSDILGRDQKSQTITFERLERVDGVKKTIRFMGTAPSFTYPANTSAEIGAATVSYAEGKHGEAEFLLAHGSLHYAIPHSEVTLVDGQSKKGASLMEEYMQFFMSGIDKELSAGVLSANAPSLTAIGGIVYAVDDGIANSSYSDYGGLLRGASGNENFRSYVKTNAGEFTLELLQEGINQAVAAGGNPTICPVGTSLFGKAQQLARSYQLVTTTRDEWDTFGGKYVNLAGVDFCLEGGTNAPTDKLVLIDPTTWIFIMNSSGFKVDFHDAPWLTTSREATIEFWVQLLCKEPWKNAKIQGVTV